MPNTTIMNGSTIEITPDGSTDWLWNSSVNSNVPKELRNMKTGWFLKSISVKVTEASDEIIMRDGGIDAAAIFDSGAAIGGESYHKPMNPERQYRPVMDASDCTFGTAGDMRIYLELA